MRILITNWSLASRAGSELYVRDLAIALLRRGHTPVVYSPVLGDVATEIRNATVPVIDSLDMLAVAPDIIHGQHHQETMTALLRFPTVPAVFFCHGWLPWEETPPPFPRILRYVAVDHTCRDRLLIEHGIPEDRIAVILNFVDLGRFKPRVGALPDQPQRALVFSNRASESSALGEVRKACAEFGISVDVIGEDSGVSHARPEERLGDYDLVFAKARAALEAMAVGSAVVLCDEIGSGAMVSAQNFDRLRVLNFGIRSLSSRPADAADLAAQISKYDPADVTRISQRVREEAGLEAAVDQIVSLYEKVISEFASRPPTPEEDARAGAQYLRWLSTHLRDISRVAVDHSRLLPEYRETVKATEQMSARVSELESLIREQETDLALTQARYEDIQAHHTTLQIAHHRVISSPGWRLLARYGSIKHRLMLPVLRKLGMGARTTRGGGAGKKPKISDR